MTLSRVGPDPESDSRRAELLAGPREPTRCRPRGIAVESLILMNGPSARPSFLRDARKTPPPCGAACPFKERPSPAPARGRGPKAAGPDFGASALNAAAQPPHSAAVPCSSLAGWMGHRSAWHGAAPSRRPSAGSRPPSMPRRRLELVNSMASTKEKSARAPMHQENQRAAPPGIGPFPRPFRGTGTHPGCADRRHARPSRRGAEPRRTGFRADPADGRGPIPGRHRGPADLLRLPGPNHRALRA